MRRIVIWLASTVTVVVLLFGYHTSTDRVAAGTTGPLQQVSPPTGTSSGSGPNGRPGSASLKTVTGDVAQTEWGPVQVQITVKAKKITAVKVVRSPSGNPHDFQINSYALPILVRETLSAQSAKIDMISGATITSGGYVQSLQSALDQAGI